MTRNELLVRIAAVLSTLAEMNTGTPESTIYMLCQMNMDEYQIVRDVLLKANLVVIKGNFVTLTAEGKSKGDAINARLN